MPMICWTAKEILDECEADLSMHVVEKLRDTDNWLGRVNQDDLEEIERAIDRNSNFGAF